LILVADVVGLGPGVDEPAEPVGLERPAVVRDQHDRADLTGGLVGDRLQQRLAGKRFRLHDRQLDGGQRVVLVGGGGDAPAELVLGPVVGDAGDPQ
jgi:hypothetical protein